MQIICFGSLLKRSGSPEKLVARKAVCLRSWTILSFSSKIIERLFPCEVVVLSGMFLRRDIHATLAGIKEARFLYRNRFLS